MTATAVVTLLTMLAVVVATRLWCVRAYAVKILGSVVIGVATNSLLTTPETLSVSITPLAEKMTKQVLIVSVVKLLVVSYCLCWSYLIRLFFPWLCRSVRVRQVRHVTSRT